MDGGFRLDIQVEERVIVEVKAVEKLLPVDEGRHPSLRSQQLNFLCVSAPLCLCVEKGFGGPLRTRGFRRPAG
jgi:hypothetical protein